MLSRVKFVRKYSSFFPGESAWLPANVVDELVADCKAMRYLEGENLEEWPDKNAKEASVAIADVQSDEPDVFNATKDPFMLDGLDDPTSMALHAGGLHTPGDVEAYINSGKPLSDIPKVTPTRAKKIIDLYGVK